MAGRSVNEWLRDPQQIAAFVQALEAAGWIRFGEPVENSRFWGLVHGERAQMFGVFSSYEQQLLRDWIASRPEAPARRAPTTSACASDPLIGSVRPKLCSRIGAV